MHQTNQSSSSQNLHVYVHNISEKKSSEGYAKLPTVHQPPWSEGMFAIVPIIEEHMQQLTDIMSHR